VGTAGKAAQPSKVETVSQGTSRALTDLFARWGTRRSEDAARPHEKTVTTTATNDKTLGTKAFGRFLSALSNRESPVLLDLGPVVGHNINFFGERLGCKFVVEDVYANLEKFAKENRTSELAAFLGTRFHQEDATFDGILCWDIFDYLDKQAGPVLAREMVRLLKPGGALMSFFATVTQPGQEYTRFLVVDDKNLTHRSYSASRGRQPVLVNRDINRMFEGLTVWESFLLMTKTREIVFRKPEHKAAVDGTAATAAPVSAPQPPPPRPANVVSASAARLASGVPHTAVKSAAPAPAPAAKPEPAKASASAAPAAGPGTNGNGTNATNGANATAGTNGASATNAAKDTPKPASQGPASPALSTISMT
jgi:SAM-dependent methyltransferase